MEEIKRLFFGAEVMAPWPKEYPKGRIIGEENRHITLSFLGNVKELPPCPKPPFIRSPVGRTDKVLFLPKETPRVVAYHVSWYGEDVLAKHYKILSHVSIARAPFHPQEWEAYFTPLPIIIPAIHLYESVGNLTYKPLWTYKLSLPFKEIEHTADIAFEIFGENLSQIFLHAQIALAFKFPPLLKYVMEGEPKSLDELIIALNEIVALTDQDMGCPFKAVSFHGEFKKTFWEMIVDV